uniref:Uncharacterized protein n=1 Tax=Arundo donax TaxID=35708 RepID=A0A0A9FXY9_ARUDO
MERQIFRNRLTWNNLYQFHHLNLLLPTVKTYKILTSTQMTNV